MKRAAIILTFAACAMAGAPKDQVRVVVLTRLGQLLPEAESQFRQKYGPDLIDLRFGDGTTDVEIEQADAIFVYFLAPEAYEPLATRIPRGAVVLSNLPDQAERRWNIRVDRARSSTSELYWKNGGVENLASFLAFMYKAAGGTRDLKPPPPAESVNIGIYHPRAAKPFRTLEAYLEWYRKEPVAGILFYETNYKYRDLAHIDALIAALERRGMGVVAAFGWPPTLLDPVLRVNGKTPLQVLFALNLGFARPDDAKFLEGLNLHVINLITTRLSEKEWAESPFGVTPDRIALNLASPERAGAGEPIVFAATEKAPGSATPRTVPIAERVESAASRAARWLALRQKPNAEKRIAFLYFNNPPGKGNIGASYLNVPGSLTAVLNRLREEGYQTGDRLPTERELIEMLERSGRNIEAWAPGELENMVSHGRVTLISLARYKTWFSKLPERFRAAVVREWGAPEASRLMTIASRDGAKFFVVPGIRFGSLFVGPQPLRTTFEKSVEVMHNLAIPPPHAYIAAYLWYRNEFRADAVVHVGRHGTLEFLPGKNTGMAGWDAAEAILGDLPNPYYYIIDGGGESTTARRRNHGTLIGHLTPMVVAGGAQAQFRPLRDAIDNLDRTSGALADQYRAAALAEIRRLKLDSQLGLANAAWPELSDRVQSFLEATEAGPIPAGIHTLGTLPSEQIQQEALAEFRRGGNTSAAEAEAWLADLRRSAPLELDSLVAVLNGAYLPSGPTGDPLRTPGALPSGRNLHDFDPALIPTRQAWALGKRMAEDTLAGFRRKRGHYPEKISMVLWYGETVRHQGAMESEALWLMGVEPVWNARGTVDSLRLVPDKDLGRPRVDVVFTVSGIYRDGFPDKILLLDRASRLAASAGDNPISRHTRATAQALERAGVEHALAEQAAQARAFAAAPGEYGAGISKMVKQSKDAGIADAYLHHMGHAYSAELWGKAVPKALATHLAGNEAVVHSRSSNVYGVLDNDDFYDYAGGLNLASKKLNGAAPEFYVNNLRSLGGERTEDMRTFLATELNARYWNPKWIREMQKGGYSGAREIADNLENLYGFQSTAAEHVDASFWENTYDVYVADKHGLGLNEFFEKENPHARQYLLARLLEVDRQGLHRFTSKQRSRLLRDYVTSVSAHGAACSANTCGNLALYRHIRAQARLISGLGVLDFTRSFARSISTPPRAPRAAQSASNLVRGYRIEERTIRLDLQPVPSRTWLALLPLAFIILLGGLREALHWPPASR